MEYKFDYGEITRGRAAELSRREPHPGTCPRCASTVRAIIPFPVYGRQGIRIECPRCGLTSGICTIRTFYRVRQPSEGIAQPITPASLFQGLVMACADFKGDLPGAAGAVPDSEAEPPYMFLPS